MKTKAHAALKWQLSKVFEELYPKSELADSTLWQMRFALRTWAERVGPAPLRDVDNLLIAEFRQSLLDDDFAPRTIHGYWSHIRSVLNYVGPPSHGNPHALGLIAGHRGMRPVKSVHRRPVRVQLEDLSAMYANAWRMKDVRAGISGPDWWRAVLVLAYTSGLRRGDLWSIRWSQIDLDNLTMDFTARKTGKADVWPLHPVAAVHLHRIQAGRPFLFPGVYSKDSGSFYKNWHRLREMAGVEASFCLHDIRRTGASEIERVKPGLAAEFMQHSPRKVTDVYYLNRYEELKEALSAMRIPAAFVAGPDVKPEQVEAERLARVPAATRTPRGGVDPSEWTFGIGHFQFRGMLHNCASAIRLRLIQALVTRSPDPLTWEQILEAAGGTAERPRNPRRARQDVCDLRAWLKTNLGLQSDHDPLPCVSYGDGGAWTIWIPPATTFQPGAGL